MAVDRYLEASDIAEASRRIYRIALTMWAWALADREPPAGAARRGAAPPVVPLALLDGWDAEERLRRVFAARAAVTGFRTANRELAILRSAIRWWRAQGWVEGDATEGIRRRTADEVGVRGPGTGPGAMAGGAGAGGGDDVGVCGAASGAGRRDEILAAGRGGASRPPGGRPAIAGSEPARLSESDLRAVFALRVPLREQALWHVIYESGAGLERILALDISDLTLDRRRPRPGTEGLHWRPPTGRLVSLLVAGRAQGPLFLTDRRAPAGTPAADLCPVTRRGRLSYRRAAELFGAATRDLDPAGRGWTLRQLQRR